MTLSCPKTGCPLRIVDDVRHTDRTVGTGMDRAELIERLAWLVRSQRGQKKLLRVAVCIRRDGVTLHLWSECTLLAQWNGEVISEAAGLLAGLGLGEAFG